MFAFRQLHQKERVPGGTSAATACQLRCRYSSRTTEADIGPPFFDPRQLNDLNRRRVARRCQQRFHTLVVMAGQRTQRLGADKTMGYLQRRD